MSHKINYEVGAQVQLLNPISTERPTGARIVWTGTLAGAVRHVVLKVSNEDKADAQVFVDQGSGLASSLLYIEDIQAIMARPDFPPPDDE